MHAYRSVLCALFLVALAGRVTTSGEDVVGQNGNFGNDTVPDVGTNLVEKQAASGSSGGGSDDLTSGGETENSTGDVMTVITTIEDLGERLLLTELVEAGNISKARGLARVSGTPFPDHIPSYSGYLTVDKRFNSNLFFWFFPCETAYEDAPVLLWLQGGPGDSSLMGLFIEIGPFKITANGTHLVENPNSWHKNQSLLFIDNPVGTGFSFTESEDGYLTEHSQIGDSLHTAMVQFFKLFPELQKNDFFIAGESYAGKYVPLLAHTIHTKNPSAELKINLKGIAVGNGFTDPINMIELSDLAFQLGLVDSNGRDKLKEIEEEAKRSLLNGDLEKAAMIGFGVLFELRQRTGYTYLYNMAQSIAPINVLEYASFVETPNVRRRIHAGSTPFTIMNDNQTQSFNKLLAVNMESVKPLLEELLDHYRVMYYNGQFDLTVTYPMSVSMYQTLNWSAAEEYKQAERIIWYVDGGVAGYMKTAGKFTEVMVRNAGHMVPVDQPLWARILMDRFTSNDLPTPLDD